MGGLKTHPPKAYNPENLVFALAKKSGKSINPAILFKTVVLLQQNKKSYLKKLSVATKF
jgi:hypothetical protein